MNASVRICRDTFQTGSMVLTTVAGRSHPSRRPWWKLGDRRGWQHRAEQRPLHVQAESFNRRRSPELDLLRWPGCGAPRDPSFLLGGELSPLAISSTTVA